MRGKFSLGRIFSFLVFTFFLFLFPSSNFYFQKISPAKGLVMWEGITLPSPPFFPKEKKQISPPSLSAEGVLVKDISSGLVLYAKNENVHFPPASTTKIMTALVALDAYQPDDVLTVKTLVNDGKKMGLIKGEKITVEALLYGALVHSANDAAFTLAENYPGGVEKFVEEMNKKARELHLTETHFTNPIGFDNPNQYTTPIDLAKQALFARENKIFAKIVGTKSITVSDVSYTYFHSLENVNELLGKIPGVSGIKTGFTQNAGEVLVSEIQKNGHFLLIVVLRSQDRFGETLKLIDWVFENFRWLPVEEVISDNLLK